MVSTLDRLEKLEGMTVNSHNFHLFAEIKGDIQKLLAVVDAFRALDLRCEVEDVLMDEPACGDCEVCRVNALMAEL